MKVVREIKVNCPGLTTYPGTVQWCVLVHVNDEKPLMKGGTGKENAVDAMTAL